MCCYTIFFSSMQWNHWSYSWYSLSVCSHMSRKEVFPHIFPLLPLFQLFWHSTVQGFRGPWVPVSWWVQSRRRFLTSPGTDCTTPRRCGPRPENKIGQYKKPLYNWEGRRENYVLAHLNPQWFHSSRTTFINGKAVREVDHLEEYWIMMTSLKYIASNSRQTDF